MLSRQLLAEVNRDRILSGSLKNGIVCIGGMRLEPLFLLNAASDLASLEDESRVEASAPDPLPLSIFLQQPVAGVTRCESYEDR